MRRRFRRDLDRWEAGSISTDDLALAHPRADVAGITRLHGRLAQLTSEATPDPEATWETLRYRLPERRRSVFLGLRARRSVVAAVAAVVLGGSSVAYAAGVEQVRGGVDAITGGIRGFFGGSPNQQDEPSAPAADEDGPDGKSDRDPKPSVREDRHLVRRGDDADENEDAHEDDDDAEDTVDRDHSDDERDDDTSDTDDVEGSEGKDKTRRGDAGDDTDERDDD